MPPPSQNQTDAREITVFLVDDHPLLLNGLTELIRSAPQLSLVGTASGLEEAAEVINFTRPRVVVLDFFLGEVESLPLIPRIQRPGVTAVLTLSMSCRLGMIDRALRLGALGHVGKQEPPMRIVEGIMAVAEGRLFLAAGIAEDLLRWRASHEPVAGKESLTAREQEVFRLMGEGQTSSDIASQLGVSAKTIEAHKENLKRKMGARSSADLRKHAIRMRQEEPPEPR